MSNYHAFIDLTDQYLRERVASFVTSEQKVPKINTHDLYYLSQQYKSTYVRSIVSVNIRFWQYTAHI